MGIEALLTSQIIGFAEAVDDEVNSLLVAGTGITLTYNDGANTLTIASSGGIGGSTGSTGNVVLRSDGTGGATLQNSAFVIPDNATASPNNTVNHASFQATGATANVSVSIVPKGTGAFCLQVPDGTTTGGNARGSNAIDLQTSRGAANQVASAADSVAIGVRNRASSSQSIAIGYGNTVTGLEARGIGYENTVSAPEGTAIGLRNTVTDAGSEAAVAIGEYNNATAPFTFALGGYSEAVVFGQSARACGRFAAAGDAQHSAFVLRNKTTTNTATTLFTNGSSTRLTIPSGKVLQATVIILGSKSDGSTVASYMRQVTIKNVGGTTSLVGTVNTIGTDEAAGTSIAITADNTNDALDIAVTGITSETWRWVAVVEGVELAYGT